MAITKQHSFNKISDYSDRWKEGMDYVLVFLLWPLGALLAAFNHWKKPWSKNVFWLFCIFFGFTFVIAERGGSDSARYAEVFVDIAHSDLNLTSLFSSFYSELSDDPDVVSPIIVFLVSRATDNPKFLFMVYGLFFGFFYSRNLWFVLNKIENKVTGMILLLTLTFALINPIWHINGFRFWAAAQVFLFGTLPFLLDGNKKTLIWSAFSILVHYSFILPLGILGIFYLVKNKANLYLAFYLATAFLQELNLQWFQSILSFLPDIFYSKVLTYANAEYAETRMLSSQALQWYVTLPLEGLKWVNYIFVISFFIIGRKFINEREDLKTLLCFSLLFLGFANILSFVPSGHRYLHVANTFIFPFYIISFSAFSRIRKLFILQTFSLPLLVLFCVMSIRIGFNHFGALTVIGNPVSSAFYSYPVPLMDDIKRVL